MTRQQAISRWKDIASAVFWAEENLSKEWNNRLKEAPSLDKEKQHQNERLKAELKHEKELNKFRTEFPNTI